MKSILILMLALTTVNGLALNPSRTYKQRPDRFNMTYEELKVPTNDGDATLNAWYFPARSTTTNLVLISHNGEGNMADYLRRIDQFINIGYNVVIYDYRGFGESSEFEIDNNMYIYPHFQDDLESMIDYCRTNLRATLSLYGWGIGAGLSLGIGWTRPEIKHIIADTPFMSMEDLETRFETWDEPMEVPFAGYEKRFEPIFALDNPPSPALQSVLLIVGSNDVLFNLENMDTLRKKRKKLIEDVHVVENPDRKDNFRVDKQAYMEQVKAVLVEH